MADGYCVDIFDGVSSLPVPIWVSTKSAMKSFKRSSLIFPSTFRFEGLLIS